MMKIKVGDKYKLNGACQYGYTRDGIKIVIDPERLRPIDADLQVPDCSKFKNHTGWEPEISYEKTMNDLLNYWRGRVRDRRFLTR